MLQVWCFAQRRRSVAELKLWALSAALPKIKSIVLVYNTAVIDTTGLSRFGDLYCVARDYCAQ